MNRDIAGPAASRIFPRSSMHIFLQNSMGSAPQRLNGYSSEHTSSSSDMSSHPLDRSAAASSSVFPVSDRLVDNTDISERMFLRASRIRLRPSGSSPSVSPGRRFMTSRTRNSDISQSSAASSRSRSSISGGMSFTRRAASSGEESPVITRMYSAWNHPVPRNPEPYRSRIIPMTSVTDSCPRSSLMVYREGLILCMSDSAVTGISTGMLSSFFLHFLLHLLGECHIQSVPFSRERAVLPCVFHKCPSGSVEASYVPLSGSAAVREVPEA